MLYETDPRDVDRLSDSVSHEESLASALASAIPSSHPDERYLREDCGGVPSWEVRMVVDPAPPEKTLTASEEEALLTLAERARDEGHHWRAHTITEQAYAGRRSLSVLLYLLQIRVDDLEEAAFGAAAYHTMLRLLPLKDDERATVLRLFRATHRKMYTRRRHEDAAVLIQFRAAQLRRAKAGTRVGAKGAAAKGAAAPARILPFEEQLATDVPSWTRTEAWWEQQSLGGVKSDRRYPGEPGRPHSDRAYSPTPYSLHLGSPPGVAAMRVPAGAPAAREVHHGRGHMRRGDGAQPRPHHSQPRPRTPTERIAVARLGDSSDDVSEEGGNGWRQPGWLSERGPRRGRFSDRSPARSVRDAPVPGLQLSALGAPTAAPPWMESRPASARAASTRFDDRYGGAMSARASHGYAGGRDGMATAERVWAERKPYGPYGDGRETYFGGGAPLTDRGPAPRRFSGEMPMPTGERAHRRASWGGERERGWRGEHDETFVGHAGSHRHPTVPLAAVLSDRPSSARRREIGRRQAAIPPRVAATFAKYDFNRSGYLDYVELGRALKDCGVALGNDHEVVRRIVQAYDDLPNGKLDLQEFARLVRDVESGKIRSFAVSASLKPIRQPLVSPLIPPRQAKQQQQPWRNDPSLAPFYRGQPEDTLTYEPRSGLEEWLDSLPGLAPKRTQPLLGVRPLERGEAIARFLRMECSLWDAQQAYLDSHRLYLRQWIALQLQALYRGRKVREEFAHSRNVREWERRIRSAIGWWRHRTATRCFYGWKSVAQKTHRAWGLAEKMVVRIYNKDQTLAFNTWAGHMRAARKARKVLRSAIQMWQGGTVRAFRVWKVAAAGRLERRRQKKWLAASISKPEMRFAMTRWQENTRESRLAKGSLRRVVGAWRNGALHAHFGLWTRHTTFRRDGRRLSRGRAPMSSPDERYQQQLNYQGARELMRRPCVKRGRYSGRWRIVQLSLSGGGLSYSDTAHTGGTKYQRTAPPPRYPPRGPHPPHAHGAHRPMPPRTPPARLPLRTVPEEHGPFTQRM